MNRSEPQRLRRHWYQEKQAEYLYRAMVDVEPNEHLQRLFHTLAEHAKTQSMTWAAQSSATNGTPWVFRPNVRTRLVVRLLRWLGIRPLRPVLAAMKVRGLSVYSGAQIVSAHAMPGSLAEVGQRHRRLRGGNLRAAVFGVNDGLLSNTSLILGMAGAEFDSGLLLTAGIAGLLAGALSMAAGEYISMRSQREFYEHQVDLERAELALYPDQEVEEMAVIYAARGLALDDARRVARVLMTDANKALDLLAREELGLNPDDLGSPIGAAMLSLGSFAIGAGVPLAPFMLDLGSAESLIAVVGLAGASLFAVGAALSLFTGRGALWGGFRMLMLGSAAGAITYSIGYLAGVAVV